MRFVRPKRHIDRFTLSAVVVGACLPFLFAISRNLGLPGASQPLGVLEPLRALGAFLNQHLAFDWVAPRDQPTILFLLLLPTGALLVSVFRLVLGIRVLGMRAILVAIGIRAIGLLPSLSLMVAIIGSIALIRPWIRRVRLPRYARLAFVLCLSAMLMVGAALFARWLGSDAAWSVAFFPAIMMAMIAEGVAKTLEQDDLVMALWRGTWTIVLALVLVLIDGPASRLTYQFPELILTQLMAIVLLAEFIDLRLLESWPGRLSRHFALIGSAGRPKVAVVRTRDSAARLGALGRPARPGSGDRSVQTHVDALREQGFAVKVFEGDVKLLSELARYMSPDPRLGTPGGIVFNLATGFHGEGHFAHVPALLEMAGIPYTGPGPLAHARFADRIALFTLLQRAQLPVPRQLLIQELSEVFALEYPVSVRPRFGLDANRRVVHNRRSLRIAVREIRHRDRREVVVEELIRGRKISVALLGNDTLECLPLVEHAGDSNGKVCPAPLDNAIADRVRTVARAACRAAGCRDYARVDVRLTPADIPVVVDVKVVDLFARQGTFMTAAGAAGYRYAAVMRRIVSEAARRYVVAPSRDGDSTNASSGVSLAKRRAAVG